MLEKPSLLFIDHCVIEHPAGQMEAAATWYEEILDFNLPQSQE